MVMQQAQAWVTALAGATWSLYWPVLLLVLVATLIERLAVPAEKNQPHAPLLFNLGWHACYLAIFVLLSWSAWGTGISAATGWFGAPLLPLPQTPGVAGEMLRTALVLLVFDFLAYWLHRLQHAVPAFWAVHRMHHDEQHVGAATGLRQQWLQLPFVQVTILLPLAWLFGAAAFNPLVYWVPVTVSVFQHMNVRLQMGRLTPVLMGPQLHRLHHATDPAVYNSNYATLLPLWDKLFGTYRAPAPGEFGATGIAGSEATRSIWRALVLPVHYWWARPAAVPAHARAGAAPGRAQRRTKWRR